MLALNYKMTISRNTLISRVMMTIAIILIFIWIRRYRLNGLIEFGVEGFHQDERFVAKYDIDIYDDFYINVYDKIHIPSQQLQTVMKSINMTMPSTQYSMFLDVGCGTGVLTNELDRLGYNVYGIDKSPDMINFCDNKYPNLKLKCEDFMNPMAYDRNTFTHIVCTQNTIYQFKNKVAFFRNCYLFMKPNAYLIVHMIDVEKFNPISPVGKPLLLEDAQKYSDERITVTEVDFVDFTYKTSYDFSNKDNTTITETFVNKSPSLQSSVRQNQQTLYTETIDILLNCAKYAGFIAVGQVNMKEGVGDENQYIFVFERML